MKVTITYRRSKIIYLKVVFQNIKFDVDCYGFNNKICYDVFVKNNYFTCESMSEVKLFIINYALRKISNITSV